MFCLQSKDILTQEIIQIKKLKAEKLGLLTLKMNNQLIISVNFDSKF